MIPIIREMYDVSLDECKRFTDKFKKYVAEQKYVINNISSRWIFEFEHIDNSLSSDEYRRAVDELIPPLLEFNFAGSFSSCLVQFWRAEEERVVVNNSVAERRFLLTLRNQPFLLRGNYLGKLCYYRTKMHDFIVNGDGTGGGPIGRVFLNNRMEFTPDVSYYTDKEEYPQRDLALSCGIKSSLVLPWRDKDGCVVGAIEFVSPLGLSSLYRLLLNMLCSNPLYSDYCKRLCGQYVLEKGSLISVVTEINDVIGEVCEIRDVVRCAQTWMLCKHCNSLSTVKRCAEEPKASSEYFMDDYDDFLEYQDYYNLKKGERVVGKAAESSHDLVYCEDVAEFSITEYPLAHFARYFGFSASFAICLKSNQTGDQVYVLEFFLHPDNVKGKNSMRQETLVPILETMRYCSKTLKFASGGEIGVSLPIQVIDARFSKKNENFKIGRLNSTHGHITETDFNTSPAIEVAVAALENFRNFEVASGGDLQVLNGSFLNKFESIDIEMVDLTLGIGVNNVGRGESMGENNDPMFGVETSCQDVSATTFRIERPVTIKANYKGSFLKFKLSPSSGIDELNHQVSHRLELAIGTYYLEYRDDMGDHILLACDEDLQMYISSSTKEENYTLLVFVLPR